MDFVQSEIVCRVAGARELMSNLDQLRDSCLPFVKNLMEKAEWWRFKNPYIARLLVQLQDAAYDAEDLIAEFDYYELQRKIEPQIPSQLLSSLVSFFKNLVNNSASKVKNIHAKLNSISDKLEREIGPLGLPEGPNPYGRAVQSTTSSINPEKVFGRENELEMVVKLMMQGDRAGCSSNYDLLVGRGKRKVVDNISILPIVGIGGIGKTTLAQLIYNDARVKNYFDLKIWVCVSDYFDLKRVTREMIESANVELSKKSESRNNERQLNFGDSLTSLESLQQTLHGLVESKRCLIVLDDIWLEQTKDFQSLCNPLKSGLQGSMILITTRLGNVAKSVGNLDPIELRGMPDNIYWDFFKRCAFGSLDPSSFPELEDIGKKIADRLKGSPLAAKTLGGILHVDMTTRQWRNILNSKLWQIKQGDGDILPALRVSYQYLPIHLKRCFLSCSLFPKDYQLNPSRLIPIWMADGIIPHHEKNIFGNEDNIGEEYFTDLESRSFILRGQYGRLSLHDHMHDLAKSLSCDTCYCQEDNKWYLENHLSIRHLSVYHKPIELIDTEIGKCKKLRSLLFLDDEIKLGPSTLASLFNQLPYLRVLDLQFCKIQELPDTIGKLKLLFYINLCFTKIRSLPESICQLYNLEVVHVDGCRLERFPKMFNNLINLRLITKYNEISSLIPGIGKLTSLEELREFKVLNKDGHKVEELKNMTRLHGRLKISNLENVDSRDDASQACLNNMEYLTSLDLGWSDSNTRIVDTVKDESIIEGLEPHSNLEKLYINYYGGRTPASWLQTGKLSCLQKLYIMGCSNLESLEDWFVRRQLLSLRELEIEYCEKLASLPFEWIASSSLSELVIRYSPLLSCPSNLILPSSLTSLVISSCGELDKSFPSCLQNLYSLNQLHLYNCNHVASLPILSNHLKELRLTRCAELQYLEIGNPFILENLTILYCPKLMQSDPLGTDNKSPTQQIKHLHELEIDNTSLLKLPFLLCPPSSLNELSILNSPEGKMFTGEVQGWLSRPENLEKLKFERCSNLESLPEELHTLETVKSLEIINCPKIQSLPENGLPPSLKKIRIISCRKIQSLPENGLPPSLNNLYFYGCHPALMEDLRKLVDEGKYLGKVR